MERSAHGPLDKVTVNGWEPSSQLISLLDIVLPHVHRLRTLGLHADNRKGLLELVLGKFNNLKFPSLIRTTISGGFMRYPYFLRPESRPLCKTWIVPLFLRTTFLLAKDSQILL